MATSFNESSPLRQSRASLTRAPCNVYRFPVFRAHEQTRNYNNILALLLQGICCGGAQKTKIFCPVQVAFLVSQSKWHQQKGFILYMRL
jgi:hypothetical protein